MSGPTSLARPKNRSSGSYSPMESSVPSVTWRLPGEQARGNRAGWRAAPWRRRLRRRLPAARHEGRSATAQGIPCRPFSSGSLHQCNRRPAPRRTVALRGNVICIAGALLDRQHSNAASALVNHDQGPGGQVGLMLIESGNDRLLQKVRQGVLRANL